MNEERGDFEWKDDEVIWVPKEEGPWTRNLKAGTFRPDFSEREIKISMDSAIKIYKAVSLAFKKNSVNHE